MLAWSEIGPQLLASSDDGYNVKVGGGIFQGYADHPRELVEVRPGLKSTAAGRYQILSKYWDHYKQALGLPDFGPASQDRYALQQILEQGALEDVVAGRFDTAVQKVSNIWASLPGAGYGQRENAIAALRQAYTNAGGKFEGEDDGN